MKNVKFLPWVGNSYDCGVLGFDGNGVIRYGSAQMRGRRIMVLGESHYCANPETEAVVSLTIDIISDLINPSSEHEPYKNTYTKFAKSAIGTFDELSDNAKSEFWNHVLFYNYVQTAISGARVAPTNEEFKDSKDAFFEVLAKYKPDLVIVWGSRLYNNLPQTGNQLADLVIQQGEYAGRAVEMWSYEVESKFVALMPIVHPSAGFDLKLHNAFIRQFIEQMEK
jgi:hypothetical protein